MSPSVTENHCKPDHQGWLVTAALGCCVSVPRCLPDEGQNARTRATPSCQQPLPSGAHFAGPIQIQGSWGPSGSERLLGCDGHLPSFSPQCRRSILQDNTPRRVYNTHTHHVSANPPPRQVERQCRRHQGGDPGQWLAGYWESCAALALLPQLLPRRVRFVDKTSSRSEAPLAAPAFARSRSTSPK